MATRVAGLCVSEIGLPEVDAVLQARIFTKHTTNDPHPPQPEEIVNLRPRRFQEPGNHINSLPDEILQSIVSRLRLNEGAATAILSRRWRNIWPSSLSVINFDLPNKVGHDYLANRDAQVRLLIDKAFLLEERRKFTGWLDQVLQLHHTSLDVNALRICSILGKESASAVDRWVEYAANKGLIELELDFKLHFLSYPIPTSAAYEFPFQSFTSSSLNYLCLECVRFNFPSGFTGFNSLKFLTLVSCFLSQDNVLNILSNCSSLECFSLLYCTFCAPISTLEFSGPSLRLKHLCLFGLNVTEIELHDVGIISFEYNSDLCKTKLSIKNAPHLSRLVLCTKTPVDILGDVPPLETLFMATSSLVKESILPNLHVFNNLKRLVFTVNYDTANLPQVMYILEKCPLLQKLELDMGISSKEQPENLTEKETIPERPYTNLREIEIYGFQDHREKIELVEYLFRNAVVLEMIKVSRNSRKYLGNGEWSLYERTANQTRP